MDSPASSEFQLFPRRQLVDQLHVVLRAQLLEWICGKDGHSVSARCPLRLDPGERDCTPFIGNGWLRKRWQFLTHTVQCG